MTSANELIRWQCTILINSAVVLSSTRSLTSLKRCSIFALFTVVNDDDNWVLFVKRQVGREVEVVVVGDVVKGLFARALVRGDVDPHCSSLGAREADGGAIVVE